MWFLSRRLRRQERVRFVYLTETPSRAHDVARMVGDSCEMSAHATCLEDALAVAARTGVRVLLMDHALAGANCRDIVAAAQAAPQPLAVVVILDSFDGPAWLELICTRVYDIVLRPTLRESLAHVLCGAHGWAEASMSVHRG